MSLADAALHFMRVDHPDPFKRLWLALVLAAMVLKLWVWHRDARKTWLGIFLQWSCIAAVFRMSAVWDGVGETLLGIAGLGMAIETVHICSPRGWPGRYGSTACLCAALAAVCGVAARGVPNYPGFTVWGYRARLYAQAAAFGLCLAIALLSAIRWDRAAVRRACFALAMLALPLYGLLTRNTGDARWHTRMALAVVELLVLVAWIITAPGIPVRLRVSAGEKAVKTF